MSSQRHRRICGRTRCPDQAARQPITLDSRAGAGDLMSAWRKYVLERDAPLTCRQRALVAHAVAVRLGDASMLARPSQKRHLTAR